MQTAVIYFISVQWFILDKEKDPRVGWASGGFAWLICRLDRGEHLLLWLQPGETAVPGLGHLWVLPDREGEPTSAPAAPWEELEWYMLLCNCLQMSPIIPEKVASFGAGFATFILYSCKMLFVCHERGFYLPCTMEDNRQKAVLVWVTAVKHLLSPCVYECLRWIEDMWASAVISEMVSPNLLWILCTWETHTKLLGTQLQMQIQFRWICLWHRHPA